jgi:hypothetical protein
VAASSAPDAGGQRPTLGRASATGLQQPDRWPVTRKSFTAGVLRERELDIGLLALCGRNGRAVGPVRQVDCKSRSRSRRRVGLAMSANGVATTAVSKQL